VVTAITLVSFELDAQDFTLCFDYTQNYTPRYPATESLPPKPKNSFFPIHSKPLKKTTPNLLHLTINECGCIEHTIWMYAALMEKYELGEIDAEHVRESLLFHGRCLKVCGRENDLLDLLEQFQKKFPK
jgi:hypothetical protein